MKPQKIAVLFGGRSPEYRVSLESAAGVLRHMDRDRFTPVMVGITPAGDWLKFSGSIEEIEAGSWLNSAACVPAALSPNPSDHALLAFHDGGVEKIPLQAVFPVLHGKTGKTAASRACVSWPASRWSAAAFWPPPYAWTRTGRTGWCRPQESPFPILLP